MVQVNASAGIISSIRLGYRVGTDFLPASSTLVVSATSEKVARNHDAQGRPFNTGERNGQARTVGVFLIGRNVINKGDIPSDVQLATATVTPASDDNMLYVLVKNIPHSCPKIGITVDNRVATILPIPQYIRNSGVDTNSYIFPVAQEPRGIAATELANNSGEGTIYRMAFDTMGEPVGEFKLTNELVKSDELVSQLGKIFLYTGSNFSIEGELTGTREELRTVLTMGTHIASDVITTGTPAVSYTTSETYLEGILSGSCMDSLMVEVITPSGGCDGNLRTYILSMQWGQDTVESMYSQGNIRKFPLKLNMSVDNLYRGIHSVASILES